MYEYLDTLYKLQKYTRYLQYNYTLYCKLHVLSSLDIDENTIRLACCDPIILSILRHVNNTHEAMEAIDAAKSTIGNSIRNICAGIKKYVKELWEKAKERVTNFTKRMQVDEATIHNARESPELKAKANILVHGPQQLQEAYKVCESVKGSLSKYFTQLNLGTVATESIHLLLDTSIDDPTHRGMELASLRSVYNTYGYIPSMEANTLNPDTSTNVTTQPPKTTTKSPKKQPQDRALEREIRGRINMVKGVVTRNKASIRLGAMSKPNCISLVSLAEHASKVITTQQTNLAAIERAANAITATHNESDPRVHNLALINTLVIELIKSYDKIMTVAYKEALMFIEKCCDSTTESTTSEPSNSIDQIAQAASEGKVVA